MPEQNDADGPFILNGAPGADYLRGVADTGAILIDQSRNTVYFNVGTKDAPVWTSGLSDTGVAGMFNEGPGLQNWRYSWGRMGKGLGGSDIVVLGDSICGGAFGTSYLWDNMWFRAQNYLQDYFNPSDVQGGKGCINLTLNGGTWTRSDDPVGSQSHWLWTPSDAASWTVSAGGTGLHAGMRRAYHATNGNNSRARFVFDGTASDAVKKRMQVTDLELLYTKFSGDATLTWDRLTSNAFVAVGSGASTGTINANAATDFSVHSGRIATGLTKTNLNGIQVGVASGTANSRPDGVIAYCEDWDSGVRLHNLAINGARADYVTTSSNTVSACISKWGSTAPGGTPAGATQAGLFVLGFYLNDVGLNATPTIALATFLANYAAMIVAAQACASKPSVLIFIPQVRNNANTLANYAPYVAGLYNLAAQYNCALLDMNAFFGNTNYTDNVTTFAWGSGDGTHYGDIGQEGHAQVIVSRLTR